MPEETLGLSIVLPCYNEVGNVEPLVAQIEEAVAPLGLTYEIIYVDDGSNDGTRELLDRLAAQKPHLRVLKHYRNFGESAGMKTGFEYSRGELIVTMDADLQNDPADIPMLVREIQNVDCVCGVRRSRMDTGVKRASSRIANRVRSWALNDRFTDTGCTYRILRRKCIENVPGFRAMHRFLPVILTWHGFKVIEIPINDRPRHTGTSKYGVGNRLWVGIYDLFGMRWYRRRFFPPARATQN